MRGQASSLMWFCQMFTSSLVSTCLSICCGSHESGLRLLKEHLSLCPRQTALVMGTRKFCTRPCHGYSQHIPSSTEYTKRKCGPLLCSQTDLKAWFEQHRDGWWMEKSVSLQGTVKPSKELNLQINIVLPLCWNPHCSTTARMVKYYNERREWVLHLPLRKKAVFPDTDA